MRRRKLMHFSHNHPLRESNVHEGGDGIVCAVCELDITSSAYRCGKCDFFLHKDCFEVIKLKLEHKFHPAHPLTLLSSPASGTCKFNCNACGDAGTAFRYHCSTCDYNLHVNCAHMPETLQFALHQHPITLHDSILYNEEETELVYDVCDGTIRDGCWVYCCSYCDFGSHLDCVLAKILQAAKEKEKEKVVEGSGSKDAVAPVHEILQKTMNLMSDVQSRRNLKNATRFLTTSKKKKDFLYDVSGSSDDEF